MPAGAGTHINSNLAVQKATECQPSASGGSSLELHIYAFSTPSIVRFFPKRTFACPVKLCGPTVVASFQCRRPPVHWAYQVPGEAESLTSLPSAELPSALG